MKTIVIYNSQTGFTKRYAQWIAEETGAQCVDVKDAKKIDLKEFDNIVFGGWAMAGSITKVKWFCKKVENLNGKKLVAFCVGASPIENPEINEFLKTTSAQEEFKNIKVFYCPGGLAYDKMSGTSRTMMKMFVKMLNSKKDKTEDDLRQIEMVSSSYDIADKKYIKPIVDFIKG